MARQCVVTSIDLESCNSAQRIVVLALPALMYVQAGLAEGVAYPTELHKVFHCFDGIFGADPIRKRHLRNAIEWADLIHIEARRKGNKHTEVIVEFQRRGTVSCQFFFDISPRGSTSNNKVEDYAVMQA